MAGAAYADVFIREGRAGAAPDRLSLSDWNSADWRRLLDSTTPRPFRASEVVIQRGVVDRALYLVAEGMLEVGVTTFDGVSVASLARIAPGSVIGEQSFFDGEPRSANVWGVTDGTLLRWDFDQYKRFGEQEPALTRDFLFAIARVLSARLRLTTIRIRK